MLGTILSFIVAFFYFQGWIYLSQWEYVSLLTGSAFFVLFLFLKSFKTASKFLQKSVKNGNPFAFESYKEFPENKACSLAVYIFFFVSLGFAMNSNERDFLAPFWLVSLGVTLDFLRAHFKNIQFFIDPLLNILQMEKRAFKNLKKGLFFDFCEDMNALYALALKGIDSFSLVEVQHSVQSMQNSLERALKQGSEQEKSFAILFVLERLGSLLEKAEAQKILPLVSFFIGAFGKFFQVIIRSEKEEEVLLPIAMSVYAPLFRKKESVFTERMYEQSLISLQEALKVLINEGVQKGKDIRDSFYSGLGILKELLDKYFLLDKKRSMNDLKAPLLHVKAFLEQPENSSLFSKDALIQAVNSLLLEINTLEDLIKSMPQKGPTQDLAEASK